MTVRQLYPQDMHTLPVFVHPCNDGVLLEAIFSYYLVCVSVAMRSKRHEDAEGGTRDERRVCGAVGRRDGSSLLDRCFRASYAFPLNCVSKFG
jgi:hypothetical protein